MNLGFCIDRCNLLDLIELRLRDRAWPEGWVVAIWDGQSLELHDFPDDLTDDAREIVAHYTDHPTTQAFLFINGDLVEQKG